MNWGYKLFAVFVVFTAMIGYMAWRCFGTNFELVEKEYYKSELRYQEVIDGKGQAGALSAAPVIMQSGKEIILQMPNEMKDTAVSGDILFYCAYDAKKDTKILLSLDKNGTQSFTSAVTPGTYTVKIDWRKDGKKYYAEKNITIL
jgi:hypothetical protein